MGYLSRDPELRYTPKGTAVANVGIAVNRKWKDDRGEEKQEVTFVDCTAWGKTGEVMSQYLRKGSPAYIEGRLNLQQWDDKQTGQKRSKLIVIIESFQFLESKGEGESDGRAPGRTAPSQRPAANKPAATDAYDGPPPEDDDVPF